MAEQFAGNIEIAYADQCRDDRRKGERGGPMESRLPEEQPRYLPNDFRSSHTLEEEACRWYNRWQQGSGSGS